MHSTGCRKLTTSRIATKFLTSSSRWLGPFSSASRLGMKPVVVYTWSLLPHDDLVLEIYEVLQPEFIRKFPQLNDSSGTLLILAFLAHLLS